MTWEINRGFNDWDLPKDLLDGQTTASVNVLVGQAALGQKRSGSAAQTFTGDAFTGYAAIAQFVAGQDDTAQQFMWLSKDATTKILRVTAGSAATSLTMISAVLATQPWNCSFATLNGRLYIAVRLASNVNRMLVYDPNYSTSAVRFAGFATPAAPTAANTGSGSYTATLRYYRIAWRYKSGSVVIRESLYGPALSFTPSGSGTAARVTKPTGTSPAEGETHWVVAGSADGVSYYVLSEIVVGTTTYDDSAQPSTYSANTAVPSEGSNTPIPACKFIVSTGDRLVCFGAYEPGVAPSSAGTLVTKDGRVLFTPVLDSSTINDDERISNTTVFQGWIDIARNAGSEDRALCGPLDGQILAFFSRGLHRLVPTADASKPFKRIQLSNTLGAVNQQSTFIGEDEQGLPCIYFLDPVRGPYRYGRYGLQWCGYDIQQLWTTFNPSASRMPAHGLWHPELKMAIWWIATSGGAGVIPDTCIAFAATEGRPVGDQNGQIGVRYGWMKWTGDACKQLTSCLFSKTFGSSMARQLKPYAADTALLRIDDDSSTDDAGTTFAASVTSRAFSMEPLPLHANKSLGKSYCLAGSSSGVTITQSLSRNYGDETPRTSTVSLTAAGAENVVLRKFEDAALTDAYTFQVTLGDAAAASNGWTLHDWYATVELQDER